MSEHVMISANARRTVTLFLEFRNCRGFSTDGLAQGLMSLLLSWCTAYSRQGYE